jgi:hypothetical protein
MKNNLLEITPAYGRLLSTPKKKLPLEKRQLETDSDSLKL